MSQFIFRKDEIRCQFQLEWKWPANIVHGRIISQVLILYARDYQHAARLMMFGKNLTDSSPGVRNWIIL